MAKPTDGLVNDLESGDYDVLEDIQPEDYVFVLSGTGQLKGISFPEDFDFTADEEFNPEVEEIIKFLLEKHKEMRPQNSTLH